MSWWDALLKKIGKPDVTATTEDDNSLDTATRPVDRGQRHAAENGKPRQFKFLTFTWRF